jgi:CrcB protein
MQSVTTINVLAVALGAAFGACGRWWVGLWLNTVGWPWGTLAVNLAGGYLIGIALAVLAAHPDWPQWIRLAAVTGCLGGLTTFSTFSAETVAMLERGDYVPAVGYAGLSLVGSLVLTALGLASANALLR